MRDQFTPLVCQPIPEALPASMQEAERALEQHLASSADRILVNVARMQHLDLLLLFVDRLLRFTGTKNILLLSSAASKAALVTAWKEAVSFEDGQLLTERYTSSLSVPPDSPVAICIASLREVQVALKGVSQFASTFDLVLIFDMPTVFLPLWQQVLSSFVMTSFIVGFCWRPSPQICTWFGNTIVTIH